MRGYWAHQAYAFLQRLRDYFDEELLAKAVRNMELTPRAEALKVSVRDLLVRIEGTVSGSSQFDPSQSERCFTIVACEYTLATIAPALLRHCERIAPDVKFNFVSQLAAPERLLEQGTADLLIIPKEFCSNRYPSEVILHDDYCAVAWSREHYASRKLSRKEFSRAPHVVMRAAEDRQSPETHLMTQRGVERRIDVTTDSFSALPGLFAGANRIATMHRRFAKEAIGRLPIKIVELPFKLPPMQLSVQWHRYRSNDTALS
ncbi:LysR substrate-binding domain-containing protein [Bradyrhizobium sp. CCGUVB1N3]|uniref:LysR substrate-binding domain-containing protein n=1 Tax=Bradyrhizobium sp. CCGUVB1N3 TaxID=2949629 RepID=UPI0020B1A879|nr:LysR substrate-binding domain-containing protein [Bradyrhizobium sp. CCGUVB1N3]MCP3475928.1 LysR substrate-binding domain-containing protein [Bradyrhizobium sp. CCGUVB1N3]